MNKTPIFFFIILTLILGCKPKQSFTEINPETSFPFEFLDSTNAATAIISDSTDHYFEKATTLDMSIQMKRPMNGLEERDQVLEYYKAFLQDEVLDFSDTEKTALKNVLIRAMNLCNSLSANLVPTPVKLIKTKGNHYGQGSFYTRERCIIIPESDLRNFDEDRMLTVMLHELSHIITRYRPKLRDELYKTIGFEKIIQNESELNIPEPLKIKLLGNPDGLSTQHAIRLVKPNGQLIWALPLVYSEYPNYTPEVPFFFGYLRFQLFELVAREDGTFTLALKNDGRSTLNLQEFPAFFEKITDNTDYIIHPDEIIADNFYLMLLSTNEMAGFSMDKFSENGQKLIKKIKATIIAQG